MSEHMNGMTHEELYLAAVDDEIDLWLDGGSELRVEPDEYDPAPSANDPWWSGSRNDW